MRPSLLVVPLLVCGCHRPWLQAEASPAPNAGYGAPAYGGSSGGYVPPAAPASPYQPAVHHPAPAADPTAPTSLALGQEAARAAQALEGQPYCWGGTGPDCYDCSGLASAAWARVGIVLPRTSDAMREQLQRIHWSQVQPGDILWRPGHVGLYVERGWAIHAPGEGKAVQYQPAQTYEVALRPY